ncbi:MAG: phosphatase PAP2 family protein [Chitinivibrionales bacterium]|nr:phosphatase PAP2 family protein [Chitinivibrionales bacterium]
MIQNIIEYDITLFLLINQYNTIFFDYFFLFITQFGNGWVVAPVLTFLVVKKIPRKLLPQILFISVVGIVGSGMVNHRIKKLIDRPRPLLYFQIHNDQISPEDIHVVGKPWKYRSFPSGHTNTAFSAATLCAFLFGGWYYLTFILAALVGYSRIYMGVHFPLDVLFGAIDGILMVVVIVGGYKWIFLNSKRSE